MKKVALLTSFVGKIDPAYSLSNVVGNQLKMLVKYGYRPTLIVRSLEDPQGIWANKAITIKRIPNYILDTVTGEIPDMNRFGKDAEETAAALYEILKDHDVCITHDTIFQKGELIQNAAARMVAEKLPNLRWLHWIHSGPESRANAEPPFSFRYIRFPNSCIVYPNTFDINRVAAMYDIEETDVKLCHHPIDVCEFFGFPDDLIEFVEKKKILGADIIAVYPIRLDRGKQPHKLISIFSHFKKMGKSIKLIICDFHSTGGDKAKYREDMKKQMTELGLNKNEVIFMSEYDRKFQYNMPHEYIRCLLQISNIFIQASQTETYSLIAQEAAICRNLLILNEDFPAMRDIYGKDALYRKFSSAIIKTTYNDENAAYFDMARYINYYLENDKALNLSSTIRKTRNLDYIFCHQFEKLLYIE